MTIVNINERYRVNIDEWNHTLEKFREGGIITVGKNAGQVREDTWETIEYYPSLRQCLRRVCVLESLDGNPISLAEYIEKLELLLGALEP